MRLSKSQKAVAAKIANTEMVTLQNDNQLPLAVVILLFERLADIKKNQTGDFVEIQRLIKHGKLNRQDQERLMALILDQQIVDEAWSSKELHNFAKVMEKMVENIKCFIDENGNMINPIK